MECKEKQDIKISVICVTYNAADTLKATIESVLEQTYQHVEFIIVDGASNDGTISIVKQYPSIKFISESDKGIYDAMNKALNIATGDFVYFIGSDDVFYQNNVIEEIADRINRMDIVYYGNVKFGDTNHIHWGEFDKWKWGITNISHQAIFYPRSVYTKYIYDLKYEIYADHAYNLNLIINHIEFKYVNIIVAKYNLEGISARRRDVEFEKDKLRLVINAVGYIPAYWGVLYRIVLNMKKKLFR